MADQEAIRLAYEKAKAHPKFAQLPYEQQKQLVAQLADMEGGGGAGGGSPTVSLSPNQDAAPGPNDSMVAASKAIPGFMLDMYSGAAKSVARPIFNIGDAIVRHSFMAPLAGGPETQVVRNFLESKTAGEKLGDAGGSMAQFFFGGPGEAALKNSPRLLALLKSSPRLMKLLTAGVGGMDDAAITAAQTNSPTAAAVAGGLGSGMRAGVSFLPGKERIAEKLSELSQGAIRRLVGPSGKEAAAATSEFIPEATKMIDEGTLPRSFGEGKKVFGGMREEAGARYLDETAKARQGEVDPAPLIAQLDELRKPFSSVVETGMTPEQAAALETVRGKLAELGAKGGMDEATIRQIAPQLFEPPPTATIANKGAEAQFRIPTGQMENIAANAPGGTIPKSKLVDFLDPLRSGDAAASRAERAAITEQAAPGVVRAKTADTISDFLNPELGPSYDRSRMLKNIEESFNQKWGTAPDSAGIGTVSGTQSVLGPAASVGGVAGIATGLLNVPTGIGLMVAPRLLRAIAHSPRWPAMEAIYARQLEQAVAAGRLDILAKIAEEAAPGSVAVLTNQMKQEGLIE